MQLMQVDRMKETETFKNPQPITVLRNGPACLKPPPHG
jgi:hypothetical protein